jgi:hypothetical protein
MTYLSFDGKLRAESNPQIIATLLRKGWQESPPPAVNEAKQYAKWTDGGWIIYNYPPPPPITEVPMRSLRIILGRRNLYNGLTQIINSIEDNAQRFEAQVYWQTSASVRRDHPLVLGLGAKMNLSSAELDAVFKDANEHAKAA